MYIFFVVLAIFRVLNLHIPMRISIFQFLRLQYPQWDLLYSMNSIFYVETENMRVQNQKQVKQKIIRNWSVVPIIYFRSSYPSYQILVRGSTRLARD